MKFTPGIVKSPPKIEFSKIVVAAVMATYFVGVGVGGLVVMQRAPEQLAPYLAFIGAPTAMAIGFYAWKAKAENVIKLGKDPLRGQGNDFQN